MTAREPRGLCHRARLHASGANHVEPVDTQHGVDLIRGAYEQRVTFQELQPGLRVTVIEPGAVATELTDHITDAAVKANTERSTPSWRSHPRTWPR